MHIRIRSLVLGFALLAAASGLAVAQCGPGGCGPKAKGGDQSKVEGKDATLTGVVSDSACGRKHTMMAGKPDAECTRECVRMGSKYALIVGKKVYTLEGQAEELNKLAGEKATISGKVSGDTVQVASVKKA